MKHYVKRIDKDEALRMLENNETNRKVSQRVVEKYARVMTEGLWRKSGNTISIYVDPETGKHTLLNGQHRLWAIVISDVEIEFLIVEEDSPDLFPVYDTGKVRGAHTILELAGFTKSVVLTTTARMMMNYDANEGSKDPWPNITRAPEEILAWAKAQPFADLDAALLSFEKARRNYPATNAWWSTLHYLVHRDSPHAQLWPAFEEGYITGANLTSGSPVLALRQYVLNKSRVTGKGSYTNWDRQALFGVGIRAWNDYVAGKTETRYFKFTRDSLPMPKVH